MNFLTICKSKVTVSRKDGSTYNDLPAQITGEIILIPNDAVPIEVGDIILRRLPSGIDEKFIVINPGFYDRIAGMPAHYQVKFRREGSGEQKSFGEGYNIRIGSNSHVNINSTDHSINTVSIDNQNLDMAVLAEELERLRNALLPKAESAEHYSLIGQIASAESAAKTKNISDLKQVLSKLKPIGGWVLNIAKEIGVPIVIKALEARIIG